MLLLRGDRFRKYYSRSRIKLGWLLYLVAPFLSFILSFSFSSFFSFFLSFSFFFLCVSLFFLLLFHCLCFLSLSSPHFFSSLFLPPSLSFSLSLSLFLALSLFPTVNFISLPTSPERRSVKLKAGLENGGAFYPLWQDYGRL